MFTLALLIGIYSYLIFFLGISGLLYKNIVVGVTVFFWTIVFVWQLIKMKRIKRITISDNNLLFLFMGLFFVQASVNLIGALGPELGFDALWYHLTLPKLYLANHSVFYIPGGLLYYSAMPKLAEMLYIGGLSFGNEIAVKLIHFLFGLLTCLALYKFSRKFFSPFISLAAVVIFYANLVVAWESVSAYIDLIRAFFEVLALWAFVNWWQGARLHPVAKEGRKWLVWSALMVGLAITTKLLAIGSLVIFTILLLAVSFWRLEKSKSYLPSAIRNIIVYVFVALLVPLPWFVFSYRNTGNPIYPFFTNMYQVAPEPINLFGFVRDIWVLFTQASDPISPLYVMMLPLIIWLFYRSRNEFGMTHLRIIGVYSFLAIVVWYFTPRTGGGRFILPYLPVFSLLCAAVLHEILQNKKRYGMYLGKLLLVLIVGISFISIGYRLAANSKYFSVVIGQQTKDNFLTTHLNFAFGDFYDTDGYFKKHIKPTDTVLLYGFHNVYYVDFPFIDASWKKPGDTFNYIATQNSILPKEYKDWQLIYENEQTMVKLYKEPERLYSQTWLY